MSDMRPPTLLDLFAGFFSIGISGFGGVLPWARRMIVEQRRWLTGPDFTDTLALCQFLPGPNVVNLAVAVGTRFGGIPGAVVSFIGLMAAPMAIVIMLGAVYGRFGQLPWVQQGFAGLAAAASGLVLSTALRIAAPLRHAPVEAAVALVTFVAIALLRFPLMPAMLVLVPASIALNARARS
jgi:chromate transporter